MMGELKLDPKHDKIYDRLDEWCDSLESNYKIWEMVASGVEREQHVFGYEAKNKYIKIIKSKMNTNGDKSESIHAFVNMDNFDVYKPINWHSPYRKARFNLAEDESYVKMLSKLDWTGRYLRKQKENK